MHAVFLKIYWIVESKFVSIVAPQQTKKIYVPGAPAQRFFYVNSELFKSNSDRSEK